MSFRDNIKTRVDKIAQQIEVKNIEQNVNQLNIDDDETREKFFKQQNSQIIKKKSVKYFVLIFSMCKFKNLLITLTNFL